MKKWATLLAGSACALSLFSTAVSAKDNQELVFMNWGRTSTASFLSSLLTRQVLRSSTQLTSLMRPYMPS